MKIQGHELRDVRVTRVSLVDRGAARTPFKIMKRDAKGDAMTIFSRLFKVSKTELPAIVAVAVNPGADLEQAKARIEAAGFTVAHETKTDDAVVFYQAEPAGVSLEGPVIKVDGDIAMVVDVAKGFAPYNTDCKTFGELLAVEGVYPTLSMATDMLRTALSRALDSSTSSEAVAAASVAFDDAKAFVTSILAVIPTQAFKIEQPVEKGCKPKGKEDMPGDESADDADSDEKKVKKADASADDHSSEASKGDTSASGDTVVEKTAADATADSSDKDVSDTPENPLVAEVAKFETVLNALVTKFDEIVSKTAQVGVAVTKLSDRIVTIEENVQDVGGRVSKAESANTRLAAALKATLPGAAVSADRQILAQKRVNGGGGDHGLIDTAFDNRAAD